MDLDLNIFEITTAKIYMALRQYQNPQTEYAEPRIAQDISIHL